MEMILNKVACTRRKAGGCFYDAFNNVQKQEKRMRSKRSVEKKKQRRHLENLGFVVGEKWL